MAARERSRLLVILLAALPVHVAYALPPTFLSAYIINYTQLPAYYVGIIFFINALLVIVFEVPINLRMAHLSSSRSLIIGFLLAGSGFFLMGFGQVGALLMLATVLWSLGEMIVFPRSPTMSAAFPAATAWAATLDITRQASTSA